MVNRGLVCFPCHGDAGEMRAVVGLFERVDRANKSNISKKMKENKRKVHSSFVQYMLAIIPGELISFNYSYQK